MGRNGCNEAPIAMRPVCPTCLSSGTGTTNGIKQPDLATMWNHILPHLGQHKADPPLSAKHHPSRQKQWTKQKHRQYCGDCCGWCVAANPEDWHDGCSKCLDMWTCMCIDRQAYGSVSAYDGASDLGPTAGQYRRPSVKREEEKKSVIKLKKGARHYRAG